MLRCSCERCYGWGKEGVVAVAGCGLGVNLGWMLASG